jgi:heme A synthase
VEHTISTQLFWLSFASLSLLYGLMLAGIYITASHQGLSCPDWPLCPNGFNLPLPKYFFEQIHRLIALVTATVIITTAFYATKTTKEVRKTSIIAAVLVLAQIFLGKFVVDSKLEPLLVATHLSTGVLLFAMTLLTFLYCYRTMENN